MQDVKSRAVIAGIYLRTQDINTVGRHHPGNHAEQPRYVNRRDDHTGVATLNIVLDLHRHRILATGQLQGGMLGNFPGSMRKQVADTHRTEPLLDPGIFKITLEGFKDFTFAVTDPLSTQFTGEVAALHNLVSLFVELLQQAPFPF